MEVHPWIWTAFAAFILAMLAVDLLLHRDSHRITAREAAAWSLLWVSLGLGFAGLLWAWQDGTVAGEYLAGYLIEKSLSADNIFVFALLLTYFAVPYVHQHRVLFWGVLGALVLRAAFIAGGATLLEHFHWTIFVFGGLLLVTGVRMARHRAKELHPERNPVLRLLRKRVPMTTDYRGKHFFVRDRGTLMATPLLAVLVAVETTDIVFAVDSIPAIFAVTREPFLMFTSNAFAILGLRAMYFMLAGLMTRFRYLNLGLAAVLVFVGMKMVTSQWYEVPIPFSLGFIAVAVGASVVASLLRPAPVETPPQSERR